MRVERGLRRRLARLARRGLARRVGAREVVAQARDDVVDDAGHVGLEVLDEPPPLLGLLRLDLGDHLLAARLELGRVGLDDARPLLVVEEACADVLLGLLHGVAAAAGDVLGRPRDLLQQLLAGRAHLALVVREGRVLDIGAR